LEELNKRIDNVMHIVRKELDVIDKGISSFIEKKSSSNLLIVAGVSSATLLTGYFYFKLKYPKKGDLSLVRSERELLHDKFTPSKVPEDLDVIIIGSGMGGLSCAAILARLGKMEYIFISFLIYLFEYIMFRP
jgi:tRNA A22 N-methylase